MNLTRPLLFRTFGGMLLARGQPKGATHKEYGKMMEIRAKKKEAILESREKKKGTIVHQDPLVAQAYAELELERKLGKPVQFEKPKKGKHEYTKKGKDRFVLH